MSSADPSQPSGQISQDKAGPDYWETVWSGMTVPRPIDPQSRALANHVNRRFHRLVLEVLGAADMTGRRLLEIGCGRSQWLPYFQQQFGFEIAGIDYSPIGCKQTESILAVAGVPGQVVYGDFFDPPPDLLGHFDVVWSMGVIEHFGNTGEAAAAFARFLRPGGVMITVIPNLHGTVGALQRFVNRSVYQVHVPLSAEDLARAHAEAGLLVQYSTCFLSTGFGVVNPGFRSNPVRQWLARAAVGLLARVSMAIWRLEAFGLGLPVGRLFSPYVVCVARRPLGTLP